MSVTTPIERARRTRTALLELWPILEAADAYARDYDHGSHGASFVHGALYAASEVWQKRHGEDADLYSDLVEELHKTIEARGDLNERILKSVETVTPGNTPPTEVGTSAAEGIDPAALGPLVRALRPFALGLGRFFVHDDGTPYPVLLSELGRSLTEEGMNTLHELLDSAELPYSDLYEAVHHDGRQDRPTWERLYEGEGAVLVWRAALHGVFITPEAYTGDKGGLGDVLFRVWQAALAMYEKTAGERDVSKVDSREGTGTTGPNEDGGQGPVDVAALTCLLRDVTKVAASAEALPHVIAGHDVRRGVFLELDRAQGALMALLEDLTDPEAA